MVARRVKHLSLAVCVFVVYFLIAGVVTAGYRLVPAAHLGWVYDSEQQLEADARLVGVVWPFTIPLGVLVWSGQWVWSAGQELVP